MKAVQKLKSIIAIFGATLLVLCSGGAAANSTAFAESSEYSSVIADLRKDEGFNVENYPAVATDYSLTVVQIAESDKGELFLYLYQPSVYSIAMEFTTVRMSTSYDGGVWQDYKITHLSSSGALSKYKLVDFEVSKKNTRFYNIVCIHRKWDKLLDEGTFTDNHDAETAMEVAQCWTVTTVNGVVTYSMEQADVVEISKPIFGTVRYKDGQGWLNSYAVDSHFIAFSVTNWDIDKLLEADVSFSTAVKKQGVWSSSIQEPEPKTVTVTYKEYGATTGAHTFNSTKRTWDRIQTGAEFASSCEPLDDDVRSEVKKMDWVLCYYETDYENYVGGVFGWLNAIGSFFGANSTTSCTVVSDVSILRLKFISDGEVYNLGVVSHKGGTSTIVGDDSTTFWEDVLRAIKSWFSSIPWWVWLIIGIVAVSVGVILLCVFVPSVLPTVIKILQAIGKSLVKAGKWLWSVVCMPFKWIKSLFAKKKEQTEEKNLKEQKTKPKNNSKNSNAKSKKGAGACQKKKNRKVQQESRKGHSLRSS